MLREILEDTTLYEVIEKDGKLEYNQKDGKKIKICEIKDINFYEITATKSNEFFTIDNGQRITKNELKSTNYGMYNPVEVYSSSEFDEEVFGYIEKTKLLELKPNQKIYNGKSILLNTGGSVGAIRLKNKPYEYTTIDNVVVYKAIEKNCSIDYLYYSLSSVMDRSKFNYSNTLRGNDLGKADLIIKIPKKKEIDKKLYSSYALQLSIGKNIEEKLKLIKEKIKILNIMELLCIEKLSLTKKRVFEKKIEDEIIVDKKRIRIKDIKFKKIKLFDNKKQEFIAKKRMGTSEIKEGFFEEDLVNWYTIKDLNNHKNLYIKEPKTSIMISKSKMEELFFNSDKKKPISKGDILVSFKQTIGVTKIYDSDNPSYCNEAIDIISIVDKSKYYNGYISLLLKEEYLKYVQHNVGSTTLNDNLKNKIYISIPFAETFDSYLIQKEIYNYINSKLNEINIKIIKINVIKNILKKAEENVCKF